MKWGRAAAAVSAALTLLLMLTLVTGGGQARAPDALASAKGIQTGSGPYNVAIRRTAHGIPHILAADWGSLGFGYGYAFAEDNICTIAESYVTVGRGALALLRSRRQLELPRQRLRGQEPQLGLLLPADQRLGHRRSPGQPARPRSGPSPRSSRA